MPKMTACKLRMSAWIISFMHMAALVTAVRQPPNITKFPQKDLINRDEVKFGQKNGFNLPCQATGSNLTWTWKHNGKKITMFYGSPYSVSQDGTLGGHYLNAEHSGSYQCFVKDEVTGVEVFSRRLRVAVTVVGDFISTKDVVKKVELGKPFSFQCPDHKPSFGADYSWVGSQHVQFSRTKRRGISPDGGLYVMYVTQEDIDEIRDKRGLRCKVSGAGAYRESGTLKLVKNSEDPGTLYSPSWAAIPTAEEIAVEGRSKTLYCLATGRPSPSITWKKNGQRIVDGQNSFEIPAPFQGRRLNINSVSRARHQDQYSCEAENALSNGQPLIHNIKLAVEVAPKWTEEPPPEKMDIVIQANGTLECHVTAIPPAPVTWYKDGIQLQSSNEHLRIYGDKLQFVDVPLDSDGVYQCTAENRHGMIASATWVRVLAWKPSFSDVQFGPFRLLHDSQGRLQCQPSAAPPPSFQWFRNGDLISYGDSSRYELKKDGTLVIKKVDKELDAANFTCRATNFMGADSATSFGVVLVRPSFISTPTNQIVMEEDIVTFQCTASGIPAPNITWVKDGASISVGETLSFTASRDQSGKYWCVADNGLGIIIQAGAQLDVQFEPSFTTKPSDQTVIEYETASLYCAATGNPTPQITWIKDGMTVGTGNTLTFAASRNHSGNYWCLAKNGLNQAGVEENAYLDVHYKPENSHLAVNVANTTAVPFGSDITFTCTSHSHPDVHEYRFYRYQEFLGYSKIGIFLHNISKTGLYSCIPFNVVGSGERASMTIVVDGRPSPPSDLQIIALDCIEWTVKLSWIPGAPNGAPIDYYLIEQESSGNPVLFNVTNLHATEANLKLSGKAVPRFRVTAVNKFGASRPSEFTAEGICGPPPTGDVLQRVQNKPVYSKAWFLTVLVLAAYGLLFVVAAILIRRYRHGRGHKYNVKLREKKYGVMRCQEKEEKQKEEQQTDAAEEGEKPLLENNNSRNGPGPDRYSRPISYFSVSEENLFGEDVSFADEYKETDIVFTYDKEGTTDKYKETNVVFTCDKEGTVV